MNSSKKSKLWQLQNREIKVGKCDMCGREDGLSVDHIFPASVLLGWDLKEEANNDTDNFQLICRRCQLLKANKFDFNNRKTIMLIDRYTERVKKLFK